MSYPTLNIETAMRLTAAIASIGIMWDSLELIVARDELLVRFFDWRIVRSRYYILIGRPVLGALFDIMLSRRVFTSLVSIHAIAAVAFVIVLPLSHGAAALLATVVLLGHLCIHVRLLVGLDGADQRQTNEFREEKSGFSGVGFRRSTTIFPRLACG